MQRRVSLVALALVAMLAACGRDTDRPATIDQMRVVKVSGDQASQVPPQVSAAQVAANTALTPHRQKVVSQVGVDGYTSEPLVARVEAEGGVTMSLLGPSLAVVPAGTPVHWHIVEGGGKLFATTTMTDDSAYTLNRWAPSTKAGDYEACAGRLLGDGSIVLDACWELQIMPGPVRYISVACMTCGPVEAGDTIDLHTIITSARDQYQNEVDLATISDSDIGWAWYDQTGATPDPTEPESHGWLVVIPETFPAQPSGLMIWIHGSRVAGIGFRPKR